VVKQRDRSDATATAPTTARTARGRGGRPRRGPTGRPLIDVDERPHGRGLDEREAEHRQPGPERDHDEHQDAAALAGILDSKMLGALTRNRLEEGQNHGDRQQNPARARRTAEVVRDNMRAAAVTIWPQERRWPSRSGALGRQVARESPNAASAASATSANRVGPDCR